MMRYLLLLLTTQVYASEQAIAAGVQEANRFVSHIENNLFMVNGIWPFLFSVYNHGILGLMLVVMAFNVMYGVAIMASDGSGFARKVNAWMYIRSLIGIVLLIPRDVNRYALIQEFVLRVVWWSVWLCGYVFNGAWVSTIMPTDSLVNRMANQAVQDSYTQVVSMASCALSYAPNGRTYYDAGSGRNVTIDFEYDAVNQRYAFTNAAAVCGSISLSRLDSRYPAAMSRVMDALRSTAQPIVSRAKSIYSQDLQSKRQARVPGEQTPIRINAEISSLDMPFGIGRGGCGSGSVGDLWNLLLIQSQFGPYAQLMQPDSASGTSMQSTLQASNSALPSLNLDNLIQHFNAYAEALLAHGGSSANYTPPTITSTDRMVAKRYQNWQNSATSVGVRRQNEQTLSEEDVRLLRAGEEIENQIYAQVFSVMSSISSNSNLAWYVSENNSFSQYTGIANVRGMNIKDIMSQTIREIEIPKGNPGRSNLGVDINVIPNKLDHMLKQVLSKATGCNGSNCTSMSGQGLFGYQMNPRSPIAYIRDIGMSAAIEGVNFQKNAIGTDSGILAQDDKINKVIYGASSGTLIAALGVEVGLTLYPIVSWARAGVLATYGIAAVLMESYGYMGDIDAYALYKYEGIASALSSLFMIWGALFGVFMPAVPYMILLFSVVGWIFLVIEAMFATPLVALGLTHPNTHQFLGASDQTLMMFLLLALRPVTIMIAAIFSLFLSKIAVLYLNEGFIRFLEVYFSSAGNYSSKAPLLFGLMLVYSYVLFVVMVQAFSIMGMLPDKISSWIGMGPMGGTNPVQQIMGLRSSFESGAQQAAQGGSSMGKTKRAAHDGDGVRYRSLLSERKTQEIAGAIVDSFKKDTVAKGLETGASSEEREKAIRLSKLGITGNSKELLDKMLRSDKLSVDEKMNAAKAFRANKWKGIDHHALNEMTNKAGIKGYRVGSELTSLQDQVHYDITKKERAPTEQHDPGVNAREIVFKGLQNAGPSPTRLMLYGIPAAGYKIKDAGNWAWNKLFRSSAGK